MKENALQCSAETSVTDEVLQAEHQYSSRSCDRVEMSGVMSGDSIGCHCVMSTIQRGRYSILDISMLTCCISSRTRKNLVLAFTEN